MNLKIKDVIGENCIAFDDGEAIYGKIYPELRQGNDVSLDFEGVQVFASPFFNAAIGHLLKDLTPEILNSHLKFSELAPAGIEVLKRVIENSKGYYSSDDKTRSNIDDIVKKN